MPRNSDGRSTTLAFKPRARLLRLLGDQLIRDASIAVFELVKHGYDADASRVVVTMQNITDPSAGTIVVQDDGTAEPRSWRWWLRSLGSSCDWDLDRLDVSRR